MTINFKVKLYSFWRALMLPDIQRQWTLQQEHTSKDNQSSRNFKKNFKCMLKNIYVFKMSFIFKLNKTKKSYILKRILFRWWIIKVHVAQDFFPNILIVVVLTDPYWGSLSSSLSGFTWPYLPEVLYSLIASCYSFLLVFVSLVISPLYLPAPDFQCQFFFSQNSQIFL